MIKNIDLKLQPKVAFDNTNLDNYIQSKFPHKDLTYRIIKRSVDARKSPVIVNLRVEVFLGEDSPDLITYKKPQKADLKSARRVIVVGSGPAGLFAALRLVELGIKPIVIERGKDVRARRRDIASINKDHIVNPDSNYCFGEGGAGTYSDGKLYTRSKKRGDILRVLEILVAHGAHEDILYDAHPHIGTNKLPNIVSALRESIIAAGGEVRFESKVVDFVLKKGRMKGVLLESGKEQLADAVILATGHSARDIFRLLHRRDITIELKPFALGVRVEHHQKLIDKIQYHCGTDRGEYLPASSYSLVNQAYYIKESKEVFFPFVCARGASWCHRQPRLVKL